MAAADVAVAVAAVDLVGAAEIAVDDAVVVDLLEAPCHHQPGAYTR